MIDPKDSALMSLYTYAASPLNSPTFSSPWTILKDRTDGTAGFAYAVFSGPGGEIVISFRGTDSVWSGDALANIGFSYSQDRQAAAITTQYINQYGAGNVSFTGHSLGGGIAATMAVWFNRPAIVFDPAPTEGGARDAVLVNDVGVALGLAAPPSFTSYAAAIARNSLRVKATSPATLRLAQRSTA